MTQEAFGWLAFLTIWLLVLIIPTAIMESKRSYRRYLKLQRAKNRWADMLRSNT